MIASPLRYPGGKAKLFDFFVGIIKENQLLGCHYCEPYAGGAGLALKLLSGGFVDRVSLNDIDEAVWAFWFSAFEFNQELCKLISNANLTIDEWYRQSEIWRTKDLSDPLALGFATFFLNRTNRSGIIEGAGPIGGYKQSGIWKLDARFDHHKQAKTVEALAAFKSKVSISRLDAIEFVEKTMSTDNSLTYLDPPYYIKGSKLYRNYYSHEDHLAVKSAVADKRQSSWIVSYDAVEPIFNLYSDFTPIIYHLNYSAGNVSTGKEVIYLSDALISPNIKGFEKAA